MCVWPFAVEAKELSSDKRLNARRQRSRAHDEGQEVPFGWKNQTWGGKAKGRALEEPYHLQ